MVCMPVPRGFEVTSPFGMRTGQYAGMHWGTDFGRKGGAGGHPVFAVKAGTVTRSGPASGFGQWVTVDHPASVGGGLTVYGHIIPEVAVGTAVREGQRIGRINPDSRTNGNVAPHLHMEWHRYVWAQPGPDRTDPMVHLAGARWPGDNAQQQEKQKEDSVTIFGVDVSYFQDGMSLKRAAAEGMKFAIIRTNDGTFRDRCYRSHMLDAESAGLVTAAYSYLRNPSEGSSLQQQVDTMVAVMGDLKRPVWMDCENAAGLSAAHISEFKRLAEARGVRVIGAYSYRPWWEGSVIGGEPDSHQFGKFWVAGYPSRSTGAPSAIYNGIGGDGAREWDYPLGNQKPSIWQFTDRGTVAGRQVDCNAYRGSVESLRALFYGGGQAPAAGKEDEMSAEAERKIDAIYNQMTGSFKNGEYPGFDIDALYKAAAGKGFKRLTMMEGVAVVVKESLLSGDQLSGPGRDKDGTRTFGGWDVASVIKVARAREFRGLTMAQMVLVSTFGTDEDRQAVAEHIGGMK